MKSLEAGVALPVVVIFTALILTGVMVSTSYSLLGGTNRNASESQATVALFAADSLVSRLDSAAKSLSLYTGDLTATGVNDHLTANQMKSITLPNQAKATVEVAKISTAASPKIVTLKFTGTGAGTAKKVILKDYKYDPGSGGLMVNAPGAVSTYANFTVNSNPDIYGDPGRTASGWYADAVGSTNVQTTSALDISAKPFTESVTVTVNNAKNSKVGDYITLGGNAANRFKVADVTGNTLTLTPVKTNLASVLFTGSVSSGSAVNVAPLAVAAPLGAGTGTAASTSMTVPVTDPGAFFAGSGTNGDTVYLDYNNGGSTGTAVAKVTGRDISGKKLTLDFTCSTCAQVPSTAVVTEGTPLRREVVGVAGAQAVATSKQNSYTTLANDSRIRNPYGSPAPTETLPCPSGNLLFCDVLHMDQAKFVSRFGQTPTSPSALGNVSGVHYVNGSVTQSNSNGPCGSGILVITGNFDVNATNCEFKGLIYVMGNVDLKGNIALKGALVAQGTIYNGDTHIGSSGSDNNNKGGKLRYDLMALRSASALLAGGLFEPKVGTWRQQ